MDRSDSEGSFQDQWKKAFEGKTIEPPERVWKGVDRQLALDDVFRYRRQATIYKWAAVVATLIAVSVSISSFILPDDNSALSSVLPTPANDLSSEQFSMQSDLIDDEPVKGKNSMSFLTSTLDSDQGSDDNPIELQRNRILPVYSNLESKRDIEILSDQDVVLGNYEVNAIPVYNLDYFLRGKENQKQKYFVGLGLGSSTVDPRYQSNRISPVQSEILPTEAGISNSSSPGNKSTILSVSEYMSSGIDYRMGLNMGMRISNRWTIDGGMQLGQSQLPSSTTYVIENQVVTKTISLNSEAILNERGQESISEKERTIYTREELDMNSTLNFAAIPLNAGFIIVDKRFTVGLKAGLLTNLYLGHKISETSDESTVLKVEPGTNSPYRSVSFSGSTGLSIGYRFMQNIDVTVEPSFAQSLQSITKSNSDFNTLPNRVGISAGIRYNFK